MLPQPAALTMIGVRSAASLVEKVRSGDLEAFEGIIRLHERRILGMAVQMGLSPADAQDVCQECFLRLARQAHRVRPPLAAWLHVAARSRAIDCLRRSAVRRRHEQQIGPRSSQLMQLTGAKVNVCVCFECRFSAHFSLIRSVIDQGLLGHIHYAEVDYYHGIGPWYGQYAWNIKKDFGGSSLLTAGCHALDALLFFIDDRVESVQSMSSKSASPDFQAYEYDTTSTTPTREPEFAGIVRKS